MTIRKIIFEGSVLLLILALAGCAVAAPGNAGFDGEWSRTNVSGGDGADLTIKNVTGKFFEFYLFAFHGDNLGELEGTAFFTAENKAVFDHEDDYLEQGAKLEFVLDAGELFVSVSYEGDWYPLGGVGVVFDGEYTKGVPVYTNADIEEEVLGDNAERVRDLLGEADFECLLEVLHRGENYWAPELTFSGLVRGAGMQAELLIDGDKIYCLLLNRYGENGGYRFYTNDRNYAKKLPDVMKEHVLEQLTPEFVYKAP